MDEIVAAPVSTEVRRAVDGLLRENLLLKGMVVKLNRRLLAEQRHMSDQHEELLMLRKANEQLALAAFNAEDARAAAEEAGRRQTVFLSMLAHELRNPMASIAVANTVMSTLEIAHPRLPKLLGIVRRQSGHLVRLVDDLLDASRIATGKMSLQMRALKLGEVIDSALEIAQPAMAAREQRAHVELPCAPVLLEGDPVRLAQLFANLLLNASKFSAPGQTIALCAAVREGEVEVAVRDQGKGIAPGEQADIFDLFAQGAQERANACAGGLGIGLTLVRSIAQMHGGSVRVESAGAGCGSQFFVLLPVRPHAAAAAGSAP